MSVIHDVFLTDIPKAIDNASSYDVVDELAVSNQGDSLEVFDTVLDNEIGSRVPVTVTTNGNTVRFRGLRGGPSVVDTVNGDDIEQFGFFVGGGDLRLSQNLFALTHTVDFDIDFGFEVEFVR